LKKKKKKEEEEEEEEEEDDDDDDICTLFTKEAVTCFHCILFSSCTQSCNYVTAH
jgi:hypothetical protein